VLLGVLVLAEIVVVRGLMVMVGGCMVMRGGFVVVLARLMRRPCHGFIPPRGNLPQPKLLPSFVTG
jgi:hypothetical protein